MTASFILDSNICIYILADVNCRAARRLGECFRGDVVTSIIAYAEVIAGPGRNSAEEAANTRRFFDTVPALPFDRAAADAYARLPFKRGGFDRLIAAHALALGLTLVTNNQRHFSDITDLRLENWT